MKNEIKFSDGIYISKGKDAKQFTDDGKVIIFPESTSETTFSNNAANSNNNNDNNLINFSSDLNNGSNKKQPYIYRNTGELIQILECEFIEFQEEICLLKKANEDMLEFDDHDYDLIQAREDNLKIINKRINQLKDLQRRLKEFCPTHPFVIKDVFDIISLIENNRENPEQVLYQILNNNNKIGNDNSEGGIINRLIEEENKNSNEDENRNDNNNNNNNKKNKNIEIEVTGNVINSWENVASGDDRINEIAKQEIIKEIDL